jgi:hypothetical protein
VETSRYQNDSVGYSQELRWYVCVWYVVSGYWQAPFYRIDYCALTFTKQPLLAEVEKFEIIDSILNITSIKFVHNVFGFSLKFEL